MTFCLAPRFYQVVEVGDFTENPMTLFNVNDTSTFERLWNSIVDGGQGRKWFYEPLIDYSPVIPQNQGLS